MYERERRDGNLVLDWDVTLPSFHSNYHFSRKGGNKVFMHSARSCAESLYATHTLTHTSTNEGETA